MNIEPICKVLLSAHSLFHIYIFVYSSKKEIVNALIKQFSPLCSIVTITEQTRPAAARLIPRFPPV